MSARIHVQRLPKLARQRAAHTYLRAYAEKIQLRPGFARIAGGHLLRWSQSGEHDSGAPLYQVSARGPHAEALDALLAGRRYEAPLDGASNKVQARMIFREENGPSRILDVAHPKWIDVPADLGDVVAWRGDTADVIVRRVDQDGATVWRRFDTRTGRVRNLPGELGPGEVKTHRDGVRLLWFGSSGMKLVDLYDGVISDSYHCGPAEVAEVDDTLTGVVFSNWQIQQESRVRRVVEFDDALEIKVGER